jgi:hypothetical protein
VDRKNSMMFCPEKTSFSVCRSSDTNSNGVNDGASGRFGTLWW